MDYGRRIPPANTTFVAGQFGAIAIEVPGCQIRLVDWQYEIQTGLFLLGDQVHFFGAHGTFWAEYYLAPDFIRRGPEAFEERWRLATEETVDSSAPTLRELLLGIAEVVAD